MGDEDAEYKAEYLDTVEDADPEIANWLPRPGRAKVTYPGGSTFEGTFNGERIREGEGKYIWIKPTEEDDEDPQVHAVYEGNYTDGKKAGLGKMVYPNGDVYTGEWKDNAIFGEGTYVYKTTGDIYSGTWSSGKKNGRGMYQFGADESTIHGTWVNGTLTDGKWVFKDGTTYTGKFENGLPAGEGTFAFQNGITQSGHYEAVRAEDADEDEPPTMMWRGQDVVAC